jgi:hypothetical protein
MLADASGDPAAARRLRHHGYVTDTPRTPSPAPDRPLLPPDPVQYDSERNVHARKRGLPQPYIAGGNDPELDKTLQRERPYVRVLVAMAIGIVVLGFALGVLSALLGAPSY